MTEEVQIYDVCDSPAFRINQAACARFDLLELQRYPSPVLVSRINEAVRACRAVISGGRHERRGQQLLVGFRRES